MSEHLAAIIPLVMIFLGSCRIPVSPTSHMIVSDFTFEPEAFDSFAGVTMARYRLSQTSHTSLYIYSLSEEGKKAHVMTIFENLFETKGSHEHMWLGDTKEGTFAASGRYVGVLQIGAEHYEAIIRVYHR